MNNYLRPKNFHFTKEYNISPVNVQRVIYKDNLSTACIKSVKAEGLEFRRRNFALCVKESRKGKDSAVCEVIDLEENQGNKSFTYRMIDNFFARRKSTGRRIRFNSHETSKLDWVKGERFETKVSESVPIKNCFTDFTSIEENKKRRVFRRRIKGRLGDNKRNNSISVQTEI